ncbi:hypothetical protein [Enterococcus casseliflavus]|uniref:hypothetical protein n=1 Tax=Enterococcus casseliflavus TaxID=37734 RepID=UPI0035D7B142
MYLEISQDLIDNLSTNDSENLTNLLDSYKYGNHILALEKRSLIHKLNDYFSKNEDKKNILNHIYTNHQDNKSLQKQLKTYIQIISSSSAFSETILDNDVRVISLPLSYFDNQLNKASLITENTSDGKFYIGLSDRMKRDDKFGIPKNVLFNCSNDSGGGSQISEVFKNKVTIENRLAFSICDSDKKTKKSCHGDTAKTLQSTFEKLKKQQKACAILIPNVREKENLVLPSCYCTHSNFKHNEVLSELSKLENELIFSEQIFFLKLSGDCPHTLNFITETLNLETSYSEYKIGKNDLALLAKDIIYTEDYLKTIHENFKKTKDNKRAYLKEHSAFFSNLPSYLFKEYKDIAQIFLDWTCSYTIPRIAS